MTAALSNKGRILTAIIVLCAGCSESAEDYAARDARYQLAKKECAEIAAKTALSHGSFTREKADKAMDDTVSCLRSRGFNVEPK